MEQLYNNLSLPSSWPPGRREETLDKPLECTYLQQKPKVINIDTGRQLFVDDFLIRETNLTRIFGTPSTGDQPVFKPETELEMNDGYCICACPFNDGIFYDDEAGKFKMWYHAGWFDGIGYAESDDGIHWQRLSQIDPSRKDDRVIPYQPGWLRDGSAVWLDYSSAKPEERYKMLVFYRQYDYDVRYYHNKPKHSHDIPGSVPPKEAALLYRSANGIDWEEAGVTGHCGDNTSFFYNPFRKKWVFSLRTFSELDSRVRVRGYYETDEFFKGSNWKKEDICFWSRTDIYDTPDPEMGYYTQLYNLDATPYESIMLGVYSVFMGPPNQVCELTGMPKINDLKLAYSRDGFSWHRPSYDNFIASSRKKGSWDYGYAHAVNGVCLVVKDEIFFYYSAFSGESPNFGTHKYSGGSLGLARLRRDGFAAMVSESDDGYLLTETLEFGGRYLFLNADSKAGEIRAELLDEAGNVIEGFSKADCIPLSVDATCVAVRWKDHTDLSALSRSTVRIRFYVSHASLYSFWIAKDESGRSGGYMAAGGPGFHQGCDQDIRL